MGRYDEAIGATCVAMYNNGLPIDRGKGRFFVPKPDNAQLYLGQCVDTFTEIVRHRETLHPGIILRFLPEWQIVGFSQACLRAQVPCGTAPLYGFSLMENDGSVFMGLAGEGYPTVASFNIAFEHELGHIRDSKKLAQLNPAFNDKTPVAGTKLRIAAYLKIMENKVPEAERPQFRKLWDEIIGDPAKLNETEARSVCTYLGELFRYGDEYRSPRLKQEIMDVKPLSDSVLPSRPKYDFDQLGDSALIAAIQLAGFWDDYGKVLGPPLKLRESRTPKNMIVFSKMGILASSKYFSTTSTGR